MGEIQCLVPEALFCKLGNMPAYILQLVYQFLEQAPDVAPTVNRKCAPFVFTKQPYILELANVKKMWKECSPGAKEAIVNTSMSLLAFCGKQKHHFTTLHRKFMDLNIDSCYVLQSLASTVDSFLRHGEIRSFNIYLQKTFLPYFAPGIKTCQYIGQVKAADHTLVVNWKLPAALEAVMFPVETEVELDTEQKS
jgi:hypothetical protein